MIAEKRFSKFFYALLALIFIWIAGCSKSDKTLSQKEDINLNRINKKKINDIINSSIFYDCNNLKYWQNFPGTCPDNDTIDLAQVKDSEKINEIKQSIFGLTNEVVYTCETDQEYLSNHPGKCPKCNVEMIKLKDLSSIEHKKRKMEIENRLKGKLNIIENGLSVPSAKCDKCERLIEIALINDKGVLDAMIDSDNQIAFVYFDSTKTNVNNIEKLILKAGFNVNNKQCNIEAQEFLPDCCK